MKTAKLFSLTSLFTLIFSLLNITFSQNPEWMNFTAGNYVKAIAIEGNYVWVGTTGGLVKIDKTTGNTIFYNRSNSGLPSDLVLAITIDGQGNKWIGTGEGVSKFDGVNWSVYKITLNLVTAIVIDREGNKWIGTWGGLVKFDGLKWSIYNIRNSNLPSNVVRAIVIDGQGNKWIGTEGGGLAVYREGGVILDIKKYKSNK